jgi:hypothetical protein
MRTSQKTPETIATIGIDLGGRSIYSAPLRGISSQLYRLDDRGIIVLWLVDPS